MTKRLQQPEVEQLLLTQNIQLISTYTRTTDPINVKCLQCEHIHETNAGKLLYEVRRGNCPCPNCAGTLSLTNDRIDNRLMHSSIKRISSYVSDKIPVTWECAECSHRWRTRATKVLNEHTGCPKCSYVTRNTYRKLSDEEIAHRLEDRNMQILSPYRGISLPHLWGCLKCGHQWTASPTNVLNAYTGCPHCAPDGKFGRKTKRGTLWFDSGLEAYCYDVLVSQFDPDDIILQRRYPHNTRMRADFYVSTQRLWVEVSSIKTNEYRTKIEGKQKAIVGIGDKFIFASSPNQLRALLQRID